LAIVGVFPLGETALVTFLSMLRFSFMGSFLYFYYNIFILISQIFCV
jgi:hypothetical protein